MTTESYKEDGRPAQQWYWDDWFSAFDVRLCSLAARGLWIDMIGIMFKAEIRGTLTVNGKQINSKTLAKIVGDTIANVNKHLKELEEHDVFSRLGDNTIYCRRLFRESGRQDQISQIRSEAGKKGADARWQGKGQKIANMAASTSSPSSTATSTSILLRTKNALESFQKENNFFILEQEGIAQFCDLDTAFEDMWYPYYPRKVAKEAAREAFKARVKEGLFIEINNALTGYINYLVGEQVRKGIEPKDQIDYVLHPATFLKKKRWVDFIGIKKHEPSL